MKVTLNWNEVNLGAHVGITRFIKSREDNRKHNHGFDGNIWNTDIEGACAELAVAKYLGVYWDGSVDSFKKPDVGAYQIRTTSVPNGRLIVRKEDPENATYILVAGSCPTYNVIGQISGNLCKNEKWLFAPNGRPPAYFVPQSELRRIK